MIVLYSLEQCPYCRRVRNCLEELKIDFEKRDIDLNPAFRSELIDRGGKAQVPYLVDTERGVEMYESGDIMDYLHSLPQSEMPKTSG